MAVEMKRERERERERERVCCVVVCLICRQLAGSEWLPKKFIERMLTEQLSDADVRRLRAVCLS